MAIAMDPVTYTIDTTRHLLTDEGFKRRHRARQGIHAGALFAVCRGVGANPEKRGEILAKYRQRSDGLADGGAGHGQCVFPSPLPTLAHRVYRTESEGGGGRPLSGEELSHLLGFWVLAIDGSKVLLPDIDEVHEAFGTITYSNGKTAEIQGERPYALASVLYDMRNRIALDATLGRADAYEVDLAIDPLAHTGPTDL